MRLTTQLLIATILVGGCFSPPEETPPPDAGQSTRACDQAFDNLSKCFKPSPDVQEAIGTDKSRCERLYRANMQGENYVDEINFLIEAACIDIAIWSGLNERERAYYMEPF